MTKDLNLEINNLTIAFDEGRLEAVSNLSLHVGHGEAVGLVGESGSGKSLTSRACLGLLPRNAQVTGDIQFEGEAILGAPRKRLRQIRGAGIAMIFQDPMSSLNPVIRVGDSIAQVVRSHSQVSRTDAMKRAVELMERVGIRDASRRARNFAHEFSGGMRQRIMIAMALAARPRMLLADEPTTALDVIVQNGILDLLDELRRNEGMGLVLVSHDLAVVASICDRIAVMYAGEIVEEGLAQEVLTRPRMPYTVGLLASAQHDKSQPRLTSIPGSPPLLTHRPKGCRFAERCPLAVEACRAGPIKLVDLGDGHTSRCIRHKEVQALDPTRFADQSMERTNG